MATYEELETSVIAGQKEKARELAGALLAGGKDPRDIISEGLMRGITIVGQRFKVGDMFIPEVLASAHALKGAMELLKPAIVGENVSDMYLGKIVVGTVQGDIHNIGKSIVSMILESGGFAIVDIGVDVPVDKFVKVVEQERPDILGVSAMLTTTMGKMKDVVEAIKSRGLRDKVRIMIGGAPVTQSFADSIGADGYAPDAMSALDKAKQLVGKN